MPLKLRTGPLTTIVRAIPLVKLLAPRQSRMELPRCLLILEYLLPLGCCVHLTPLYDAIRRSRPEVTLVVATRGVGAALLRHHPDLDHLIETADPLHGAGGLLAAARGLAGELSRRGLRPDCVLTGASDQRSRIAVLGLLSCGGWRGGFTQTPGLYHRPLQRRSDLSLIDNNLRLAGLVGCEGAHCEPRVYFSSEDVVRVRAMVEALRGPAEVGRPLLLMVTQNSGGQRTGWHAERFAEVIRYAAMNLGCAILYVGTAAEGGAIEVLREQAGNLGTSLAGCTAATELAALLALSDFVITLDTGTMHVGRAVGVPMVVLGPSWQSPLEWLPLGLPQVRICRGEDRSEIPENYRLDEVSAAQVIAALRELMAAYPASEDARARRVERSTSGIDHRNRPALDQRCATVSR
jgi:ADP-heptose:LPS heptosyltransferase